MCRGKDIIDKLMNKLMKFCDDVINMLTNFVKIALLYDLSSVLCSSKMNNELI